jgi:hypothetical protein
MKKKKAPLFKDLLAPGVNDSVTETFSKGKSKPVKKKTRDIMQDTWDSTLNRFFK